MLGHQYAGNELCIRAGQGLGFSSVERPRGYCRSQTSRHRCRHTSLHSALPAAACHFRPTARGEDRPIPHCSKFAHKRTLVTLQNTCSQLWQRWQDSSPLAPQLYLYSSADALIPPDRIKAFMASQVRRLPHLLPLRPTGAHHPTYLHMQAERGVEIHQHDFRDSPHVEHLRWHPAQYSAALDDFMRGLLRSDTSQQSESRQDVDASSALAESILQ